MIRTLQRRFLWISMLAVSVLILLLLGAINAANIALVGRADRADIGDPHPQRGATPAT